MSTTKRIIESKKENRSTSAAPIRNFQSTTKNKVQFNLNAKSSEQPLRSVGPVTRSLTHAIRSAFSTSKSLTDKVKTEEKTLQNSSKFSKTNTKSSETNLINKLKIASSKVNNKKVTKTKNNEVKESKNLILNEEIDNDVTWVNATQYISKFDEQIRNKNPSYLRISKILSGYVTRRSLTPDLKITADYNTNDEQKNCLNNKKKDITNSFSQTTLNNAFQSSSNTLKNTLNDKKNNIESCSSYSFVVPQFTQTLNNDQAYKNLLENVLNILNSHILKCQCLLENETSMPNSVTETIRVAVGRTQLLLKKRLMQFDQQLKRHINPNSEEKETTLNDLHGLWSLIDMQLSDIRQCFEKIEESRLSNWKEIPETKPTLTTAASMPLLRLNSKTSIVHPISKTKTENNKDNIKSSIDKRVDDGVIDKKTELEAKRREAARCRIEFIKAKRLEMMKIQENNYKNIKSTNTNILL